MRFDKERGSDASEGKDTYHAYDSIKEVFENRSLPNSLDLAFDEPATKRRSDQSLVKFPSQFEMQTASPSLQHLLELVH